MFLERCDLKTGNRNLEQLFNKVMEEGTLEDHEVTDVLIDDALFIEIYRKSSPAA